MTDQTPLGDYGYGMSRPFFDPTKIKHTYDPMARLVASTVFGLKLSVAEFAEKHRDFMLQKGRRADLMTSARNNTRKCLLKERPTWKAYYHLIDGILGFELVKLSVTLRNKKTGKEHVFSSDDDLSKYAPGGKDAA